jgi:hypothetical protein
MVPDQGRRTGDSPAEGGSGEGDGASHRFNVSRSHATTNQGSSRQTNSPCTGPGKCLHYIRRMGLVDVEFAAGVGSPSRVAR